jgi:FkbM family methyltransferase
MTVYTPRHASTVPTLLLFPAPILSGPMRGKIWLAASGGKVLRVLSGSYEPEQTTSFVEHIRSGDVVLDVGAAAGYYTLLSSILVGSAGQVITFEPDPKNAAFLRRHVRANHLTNVTIHQAAVGEHSGFARFHVGSGTGTGRLANDGETDVCVIRLDDFVKDMSRPPTHMKIDVEGAEMQVLAGAAYVLQQVRPTVFLSTHGGNARRECRRILEGWDYRLLPLNGPDLEGPGDWLCLPN